MTQTVRPTAVGMYIFAGSFTVGVAQHFNVVAHLEGDGYGAKTFALNFPRVPAYWPKEAWPDFSPDLVYGNPPCAPWSIVGASLIKGNDNWRTDPRTDCFSSIVDYGISHGAKVIAVESVQMLLTRGWEFLDSKVEQLLDAGYGVDIFRHDSVLWGLPQRRRRVFLVGSKVRLDWEQPKFVTPTTMAQAVIGGLKHGLVQRLPDPYLPAWELARTKRLSGQSGSLRRAWFELNPGLNKGSPRITTGVVHPHQPVGTIIGKTQIHHEHPRYLSEGEMKRLMGLPDDFEFWRPTQAKPLYLGAVASEVARAVNPVIGAYLAKTVARGLRKGKRARGARLISADAVGKGADLTMRWTEEPL